MNAQQYTKPRTDPFPNVAVLNAPSTVLASTSYGYDDASRLKTVADGNNTAAYGYLANSPLVSNVWFTNSTTLRMTTTKNYDLLNRLTGISSAAGGSNVAVFNYAYNAANQRTTITNVDSSRWVYQYDALGQVVSGKKYWSDGTPVAGQQFEYGFDDIGNRQSTASGGDANGANLRYASYTNNSLNQITSRSVPGLVNVIGTASNSATVTLWGDNGAFSATSRKGEYFRGELAATNTSAALWLTITNLAVLNNGSNPDIVTNTVGKTFVAQTPEVFYYDLDGNLTNDGRWTYTWDAENRLTKVESLTGNPTASKRRVAWEFDGKGRRVRQTTFDGSSGSYVATEDLKFVADGWRHIAELNATNNALLRSYSWGKDLSGSLDGAGGVGGLLMLNSVANGVHYYTYDGNGNMAALVKATDGSVSQQCEYEPFGKLLRNTGLMAGENKFLFSTKRNDATTDLLLYEYRVLKTETGTWPNRDPIGELGGKNLYGFNYNNPIQFYDPDGRNPGAIAIGGGAAIGAVEIAAGIMGISALACLSNPDCTAMAQQITREILDDIAETAKDVLRRCKPKKRCKPCNPVAGTTMFRTDGPPTPSNPTTPHWIDGVREPIHTHHIIVMQSPVTAPKPCFCWPKEISATKGVSPAPGEIPEQPVTGGGVTWWPF